MAPQSRGPTTHNGTETNNNNIHTFELPDPDTPESETPTLENFTIHPSCPSTMDNEDPDSSLDLDGPDSPTSSASSASSSSSSSSRDGSPGRKRRSGLQHSSSSLLMSSFAPPFYNRPPTPLPPSPSLTSLLRPPFSTTTSRPSTPDSSDVEGGLGGDVGTESAIVKSARIAGVPRASPKVPTYEYYGFVLHVCSSAVFLMYILWSYLPRPFLERIGFYYYPDRWWSLAIPAFLVMTIVYIYVALASYNTGYLTLPIGSVENIVDEAAYIAAYEAKGKERGGKRWDGSKGAQREGVGMGQWKDLWSEGTDAVMDIPIGGVCEVLYGDG